jgi:GT2 family glycosyltransferase
MHHLADEPDISIIIVSYNTCAMTLDCIRSIIAQTTKVRYEVIVFDNASEDGSARAVRDFFPRVTVVASLENLGFAQANNVAAMRATGRRLLLLNPDTVILDHAIDHLNDFANANPRCRIWGGRTIFADGSLNPGSCWGDATLWSIFCFATGLTNLRQSALCNPEGYGGWKRDSTRTVDIVTGCFLLIDRPLWDQLAGFDPKFFMYGEEADLCWRARKLGAQPSISPAATIIHHGRSSEPDDAEQRIKVLAGRITLLRRHHSRIVIFVGGALYLMLPPLRLLVYGLLSVFFPGRTHFDQKVRNWRRVWQGRERWLHGWNDDAVRSARESPRKDPYERLASHSPVIRSTIEDDSAHDRAALRGE